MRPYVWCEVRGAQGWVSQVVCKNCESKDVCENYLAYKKGVEQIEDQKGNAQEFR